MQQLDTLRSALGLRNVQAFLRVIRAGESHESDDEAFAALYGWRPGNDYVFTDFSDHPRQAFMSPWGWTSAAGAFQAMAAVPGKVKTDTWGDFVRWCAGQGHRPMFGQDDQNLFAVWCMARRGALPDVVAGRVEDAIRKCAREWASLPGSPYGQPTLTMAKALAVWQRWGGGANDQEDHGAAPVAESLAPGRSADGDGGAATTPGGAVPEPSLPAGEAPDWPPSTPQEAPMPIPAVLSWALPILAEAVPRLGKLFGSGSPVSERNIAAATVALDVAKRAIGAANEQELAERVKTDPAAAQAVRDAIDASWSKIHQAHEESIAAARTFVAAQPQRVVVANLLFHELLALLMVLISAGGGIAALFWTDISAELKGAIVTLMLIGGWTGVKEFYFGGSRGSDRKTELMAGERAS